MAGTLAGKRATRALDPKREDAYWRDHYTERAYVEEGSSYDDYGPAYAFGVSTFGRYPGRSFADAEPELSRQWIGRSGASMLGWDEARYAVRDAWNRLSRQD